MDNFTITGNSLGDQDWSGYIPITSTHDNGTVYNTGAFGFNNGSWYAAEYISHNYKCIAATVNTSLDHQYIVATINQLAFHMFVHNP